jgi:hypothetical protein
MANYFRIVKKWSTSERIRKTFAGKFLDQELLATLIRPIDHLLRRHFRQAVFANMRRTGEPPFEHYLPSGTETESENSTKS